MMAITKEELDSFHRFVSERMNGGRNIDLSLEDCLRQWREQQERCEAVSDVRVGMEEEEAGRVRKLKEIDAEIRQELGFSR
jgi:hypothetical protein